VALNGQGHDLQMISHADARPRLHLWQCALLRHTDYSLAVPK